MSDQLSLLSYILNRPVPTLVLSELSLTKHQKKDLKDWVENLSMLNLGDTARQFFITIKELNLLQIDDHLRLELTDILRPSLHSIFSSLSKQYQNKNLSIDPRAERIATLVQEIRIHLISIYSGIIERSYLSLSTGHFTLFTLKQKKTLQHTLSCASHRCLTELSNLLYELQSLHQPLPSGFWLKCHQTYQYANQAGLSDHEVSDPTNHFIKTYSVQRAYCRVLMMGLINANKLRQTEIRALFHCSEFWSEALDIHDTELPNDTYVVHKIQDIPPVFIAKNKAQVQDGFFINSDELLAHFKELISPEPVFMHPEEPHQLTSSLKAHLLTTFSSPLERAHKRHPYQGTVELAFGIASAHYHLSNQKTFEEVIHLQKDYTPSTNTNANSYFGHVNGVNSNNDLNGLTEKDPYEINQCQILNISPGGYCVRWQGEAPSILRTGELIILRELSDTLWHIGLIRWVNQTPDKQIEFGVEVISSRGKPCGIRSTSQHQVSSFKRAILLPEIPSLNRPATVLTQAFSFHAGQRVFIRHNRDEVRALLNSEYLITQSFIQFQYIIEDAQYDSTSLLKNHNIKKDAASDEDDIWNIL